MGARCSCLSAPNQTTLSEFRLSRRRRCITACAPGCARPGEETESSVHDDSWVQNRNAGHIQNKSGPLQGGNSQPSVVPDSSGGGHIEPDGLKNADSKGDCTNQDLDPPLKASKDGKEEIKLEEEEESCPTCFEEYDKENPKIIARCGHHFHLSCILEWMERSETCPFCNQDMVFNETS